MGDARALFTHSFKGKIMIRALLLLTISVFTFTTDAAAQSRVCDALKLEKTYEDKSSFKKLEAGKGDWVFRSSTDYKTSFKVNSALENRFKRLQDAIKYQELELVIVPIPTRGMMHSDQVLNTGYDANKAISSYQDLVRKLRMIGFTVASIDDFSAGQDFYYKLDHHWNVNGAEKMAQRAAEEIKLIPAFKTIKKEEFKTEIEKQDRFADKFAHFVADICGTPLFEEEINIYRTYKSNMGEDDLFSDEATPEIILLGTSNSTSFPSYAHFEGALKRELTADIQNMSVSGGGVETAFLDYLNQGTHLRDKPKILIWEIPIYQNFKGGPLYRQLIPATYGACEGNEVFKDKIAVTGTEFTINLPENINAKNHYMYLNFANLTQRKFKINTKYNEGGDESFNVRLSKYSKALGKHFVEFDQKETNKSIDNVTGHFKKPISGDLDFSICAYPPSE